MKFMLLFSNTWYQSQVLLISNMNNNIVNSSSTIFIFKGVNYPFGQVKMKTLFKSYDLWDLVENGYEEADGEQELSRIQVASGHLLALTQSLFSQTAKKARHTASGSETYPPRQP